MLPAKRLHETVRNLVDAYPELFEELTRWLNEPKVWGHFEITRKGKGPLGHSRSYTTKYNSPREV